MFGLELTSIPFADYANAGEGSIRRPEEACSDGMDIAIRLNADGPIAMFKEKA